MARAEGTFGSYILNRVIIQTLLVLAIAVVGYFLLEKKVMRLDLTEDQRFTISEASRQMARSLQDPLTIKGYFSSNLPTSYEPLQQQVLDVLSEYEAASGGKIRWERYDPETSRAAESDAKNYGIRHAELPVYEASSVQVHKVYGGIVMLYGAKSAEAINVAQRYAEGYEGLSILEYEISSRIWQLTHERPKIGITGYLESAPQANPFGGGGPPRPEFQTMRRLLGESFEVDDVDLKGETPDPAKTPLVILVRPRDMTDVEVFHLDQYLMRGGRVLIFTTQGTLETSPFDQRTTYQPFRTGLDDWLKAQGIRIPNEFVCHMRNAVRVPVSLPDGSLGIAPIFFVPSFWTELFDQENPAVKTLKGFTLYWPHPVDILSEKLPDRNVTVLVRSNDKESWRWKDTSRADPASIDWERDGPAPEELGASNVVVAIEGKFPSFFADHPVPPSLMPAEEKKEGEGEKKEGETPAEKKPEEKKEADPAKKAPEVIKASIEPSQLVIVGNAIFVSDQVLSGARGDDTAKQASLLAFNLVDWLARSKDLIAMRAKKFTDRTIVDKDFDKELEEAERLFREGKLTAQGFRDRAKSAQDRQNSIRRYWRWMNILLPCGIVVAAGSLVWILRAAFRARPPNLPPPQPPEEGM